MTEREGLIISLLVQGPVEACGFKTDLSTGLLFKCLIRSVLRDGAVRPFPVYRACAYRNMPGLVGWGGGRHNCGKLGL